MNSTVAFYFVKDARTTAAFARQRATLQIVSLKQQQGPMRRKSPGLSLRQLLMKLAWAHKKAPGEYDVLGGRRTTRSVSGSRWIESVVLPDRVLSILAFRLVEPQAKSINVVVDRILADQVALTSPCVAKRLLPTVQRWAEDRGIHFSRSRWIHT